MGAKLNLVGEYFGKLRVVAEGRHIGKRRAWACLCECGKQTNVGTDQLRSGNTRSCGCGVVAATIARSTKHGLAPRNESARPRLYRIWKGMRQRCNDKGATNYKFYGGRGISICGEWNDFSTFMDWSVSHGYSDELSLDRKDNNGPYSPLNCRWADHTTQMRNCRNVTGVVVAGQRMSMTAAAEKLGVNYSTFRSRIARGTAAAPQTTGEA